MAIIFSDRDKTIEDSVSTSYFLQIEWDVELQGVKSSVFGGSWLLCNKHGSEEPGYVQPETWGREMKVRAQKLFMLLLCNEQDSARFAFRIERKSLKVKSFRN